MMQAGVFIHWKFQVIGNVDLFEHGDAVTEALLAQEKCTSELQDSAVSVDRGQRTLEIEVSVVADTYADAVAIGQAAVRAAIHATGAGTPFWPTHSEALSMVPTDLETSELQVT